MYQYMYINNMKSIQVQPFDLDMTTPLTQEEQQMYQFGVMKTIYVPPHPMVENTRIAVA